MELTLQERLTERREALVAQREQLIVQANEALARLTGHIDEIDYLLGENEEPTEEENHGVE